MELKDYLSVLRRQSWVIVTTFILVLIIAFIFTSLSPVYYESNLSLTVKKIIKPGPHIGFWGESYYASQSALTLVNDIVAWCQSPEIVSQIYKKSDLNPEGFSKKQLINKIKAKKVPGEVVLLIVQDRQKEKAEMLSYNAALVIKEKIEAYNKNSDKEKGYFSITFSEPVAKKVGQSLPLNLAIGTGLGLLLGIFLAFIFDYFSKTVDSSKEAKELLGLPIVHSFKGKKIKGLVDINSDTFEDFRFLKYRLLPNKEKVVLTVLGCDLEESAATAANLALSTARAGNKTIILDANFKKPDLAEYFGETRTKGLGEFLTNLEKLDKLLRNTDEDNLKYLPKGASLAYPADALAKMDLTRVKNKLLEKADVIVISCPSFSESSESLSWTKIADKIVLLFELKKARREKVSKVNELLKLQRADCYLVLL